MQHRRLSHRSPAPAALKTPPPPPPPPLAPPPPLRARVSGAAERSEPARGSLGWRPPPPSPRRFRSALAPAASPRAGDPDHSHDRKDHDDCNNDTDTAATAAGGSGGAVAPQPPPPHAERPRLRALRTALSTEAPHVSKVLFNQRPPLSTPLSAPAAAAAADLDGLRRRLAALPDPGLHTLTDTHRRHHNYLRISVAERCNLRCTYCMPAAGVPLQPAALLLTTPEILHLAQAFADAGVTKFRLTGGEPTLRPDLIDLIAGLGAIRPRAASIGLTTNGVVHRLSDWRAAGLTGVNISLDTVDPARFAALTRRPAAYLSRVWQTIEAAVAQAHGAAIASPFTVKLNCVVMRHVNDADVADFVRLTTRYPLLQVRFIEYMPFAGNGWNDDKCVPYQELLAALNRDDDDAVHVQAVPSLDPHDTTKWYQTAAGGRVGFITSMSQHFCAGCNRLRLTADGQIKVCLFDGGHDDNSHNTVSLRDAVRAQFTPAELRKLVHASVQLKHAVLGGHANPAAIFQNAARNRPMTLIGG